MCSHGDAAAGAADVLSEVIFSRASPERAGGHQPRAKPWERVEQKSGALKGRCPTPAPPFQGWRCIVVLTHRCPGLMTDRPFGAADRFRKGDRFSKGDRFCEAD